MKKEGASAKTKFFKPQTRKSFITYAMVIVAFVVMQILSSGGYISSMLTGLLVPLCVYSILAVSLNLTVGILGELSLGQAGFMCVGAYTSAIFSIVTSETIENVWIRMRWFGSGVYSIFENGGAGAAKQRGRGHRRTAHRDR